MRPSGLSNRLKAMALVLVVVLVASFGSDDPPTASAQDTFYEIFGDTWLDLNEDGVHDADEPLLGGVEVWSGESGSEPENRSRSSLRGDYEHLQTATGSVELFAIVAGLNDGAGRRPALLAPPRSAVFREEP